MKLREKQLRSRHEQRPSETSRASSQMNLVRFPLKTSFKSKPFRNDLACAWLNQVNNTCESKLKLERSSLILSESCRPKEMPITMLSSSSRLLNKTQAQA